jgi:hypothetical protein
MKRYACFATTFRHLIVGMQTEFQGIKNKNIMQRCVIILLATFSTFLNIGIAQNVNKLKSHWVMLCMHKDKVTQGDSITLDDVTQDDIYRYPFVIVNGAF